MGRNSDLGHTVNVMQWGQFLTHDMDHTPETVNSATLDCCLNINSGKDECAAIDISSDDPLYSSSGKTCMNFVRSLTVDTEDCAGNTVTELINKPSTYIDASMVYGSDDATASSLREFSGGILTDNLNNRYHRELL